MSHDNFQSLVNRLEVAWSGRPEGLLRHTVGWVALGYAALAAAVLAGFLLLATGVVMSVLYQDLAATIAAGVIALAGLGLAAFVLGCLWVRFDPPEGLVLEEADHPEFHRLLRELGDRAGGVRFYQVLLDPEMNASVVQNPRLGFFGWYRTYLVIGLPLMEALPLEELKAVVAHEIGHLTRSDGKTGAWLHRTREAWERVVERLSRNGRCPVIGSFFQWFWPRFNSRALVLSRYSELAADRFAAGTVSREALASGLVRLAVVGRRSEIEFWEPLGASVETGGELPDDVMERLSEWVHKPVTAGEASVHLAAILAKPADMTDSHPELAARLEALGLPALADETHALELPDDMSAADHLLTPGFLDRARRHFSREWQVAARAGRNRKLRQQDQELAAGSRKAWERIAALVRLDGLEKVQPEVIALLERHPAHSGALYLRGSHLAEKCDPKACEFLEQATSDPTIAGRAFETLQQVYTSHGRNEEAARIKERALVHDQELRAALVERSRVSPADSFFPHDLCHEDLQTLCEMLADEPAVKRAWLGAKEVRHFPRWPLVIIGLELSRHLSTGARRGLDARLMKLWGSEAYTSVFVVEDETKPVLRALRRAIPDCLVYCRK